jgi:DNA-directed RNA polymerase subunit RPC12/RpoP
MKIKLEIISKRQSEGHSILDFKMPPDFSKLNPYLCFEGDASIDVQYVCGACEVVLATGMKRGQLSNLVIRCPKCGSRNIVRGS